MNRSNLFKILGVSVSLASLWFFHAFRILLYPRKFGYFEYGDTRIFEYPAVLISVASFAAIFVFLLGCGFSAKKPWSTRLLQVSFLVLGLFAFGSLSCEIRQWLDPTASSFVRTPLPIAVLIICIGLSFRSKFGLETIAGNLKTIALILLPFGLFLCLLTTITWVEGGDTHLQPVQIENDSRLDISGTARNRVVWIIFDELDYATMVNRPKGVEMPGFEKLISESFAAENAYSPNKYTTRSIPSLLVGRPVEQAVPVSGNDLKLTYADGAEPNRLSATDNTISDISTAGGSVGISGWWHPYPRLFKDDLAFAYWRSGSFKTCEATLNCTFDLLRRSIANIPFIYKVFPNLDPIEHDINIANEAHVERRLFLREKALQLVSKSGPDFVFLHLPAPHEPPDIDSHPDNDYYAGLEFVDETLALIRAKLEDSGDWNRTTLIVSSDHWLRWDKVEKLFLHLDEAKRKQVLDDIRIPFIVKVAGNSTPVSYKSPFNSVITRYLIQSIRSGDILTNDDVRRWLDKMAAEKPDLINYRPRRDEIE